MKIIIFGTAILANALYNMLYEEHEIIGFTDSAYPDRWGKKIHGISIYSPEECLLHMEYDTVVIASETGLWPIREQCLAMGVPEYKINTSYVEGPVKSRITFLENMAGLLDAYEQDAAVAEAGVFQGEFAKHINAAFPKRTLHLFDTFEGFAEKDVEIEKEQAFSVAKTGEYHTTSVDLVLGKMRYPENCVIHKGYFPDTAQNVHDRFCFVNLDMDLYLPTYNGLRFFKDKMTDHGVILIHDYFSLYNYDAYTGVKAAVDKFVDECGAEIGKYPIGDGFSIMLAGKWEKDIPLSLRPVPSDAKEPSL